MGKTILTSKQLEFLECIQDQKSIIKDFYLTGGTALAAFYLHHRLSEDIDLFTELEEVNPSPIEAFLQKISPKLSMSHIKRSQFLGLFSYLLEYTDGQSLKVDFNYYPFPRIEKGISYQKLAVDSIHDIAANKIHTLFMKPRGRDYIDFYCIMKEKNFTLHQLILDAKAKFDWDIDSMTLISQFLRVKEFTDYPKMLVPFDRQEMEKFYTKLVNDLKNRVLT